MDGFLGELGRKLAERWFTLLVLPGAVYLAVAATANILGHAHALEPMLLAHHVTTWSKTPGAATTGGQILILAAVLAGAAVPGLTAQAVGRVVERLVLAADWTGWPLPFCTIANCLVGRRRKHWDAADADYQRLREHARQARARGEHLDSAERDRAYRARTRIAESRPEGPTWSGDRMHAVSQRLHDDLGLDIARIWPALWLTMPDTARAEIGAARTDLAAAAALTSWAVLYAPIAAWWWPAALIALALAATGARRIRTATDTYALLIEAAARMYSPALGAELRLPPNGAPPPAPAGP